VTVTDSDHDLLEPPRVSGDDGGTGHLEELRADPIGLMERVRSECGDVGAFRLADRDVVLLTGPEANEVFFRAPEEELDQAEAYPFMTPIFGEGVVFDASPEERRRALHNQALRDRYMRGHAETIAAEVEAMLPRSPEGGEIDLLDWFAELTIYTSSACLIGRRFRDQLDGRFARLYHELEQGTDALAYVDAYADIPSFRKRDEARRGLVELVQAIMAAVVAELDGFAAEAEAVSYQALREMPMLEAAVKEALRLHPPLILLLRVAKTDLEVAGRRIPAGALVGASPSVSNRLPEAFEDPERFDPTRYISPREDDVANPWSWIPFGAGRHRCVGAAFAMMQLKTIFAVLLPRYRFELTQPPATYRNDHSKMVVQLAQPCGARMIPRTSGEPA